MADELRPVFSRAVIATDASQPNTLAIVYDNAVTRFDLGQKDIKKCITF